MHIFLIWLQDCLCTLSAATLCKSDKYANFLCPIKACPFSAKKSESPKVPKVPVLYKKREKR